MTKIINTSSLTSKYTLPDYSTRTNSVTSNESVTLYMTDLFVKDRSTASEYGIAGDEILQTLLLTNESEVEISNIRIKEKIDQGASFKAGSVEIDGTPYTNFDMTAGITLPDDIPTKGDVTINYSIIIDDTPTTSLVSLANEITYDVNEVQDLTEDSNQVQINIVKPSIQITKSADKTAVTSGQTLRFTNVIQNNGEVTNTDIQFVDILPWGTSFVADSLYIDGVQQSLEPTTPISLKDLNPGEKTTVVFDVKVD